MQAFCRNCINCIATKYTYYNWGFFTKLHGLLVSVKGPSLFPQTPYENVLRLLGFMIVIMKVNWLRLSRLVLCRLDGGDLWLSSLLLDVLLPSISWWSWMELPWVIHNYIQTHKENSWTPEFLQKRKGIRKYLAKYTESPTVAIKSTSKLQTFHNHQDRGVWKMLPSSSTWKIFCSQTVLVNPDHKIVLTKQRFYQVPTTILPSYIKEQ